MRVLYGTVVYAWNSTETTSEGTSKRHVSIDVSSKRKALPVSLGESGVASGQSARCSRSRGMR